MNKDVRLLNEALDVLKRLREWLPPDLYKDQVTPTVSKIKERLAIIETELFMNQRAINYLESSKKFEQQQHETKIQELEQSEPDTIPSQLMDLTDQFGIFKLPKKD